MVSGTLRCGACQRHTSPLDSCLAAVDYSYPWDSLITQLKFARSARVQPDPAIARSMAAIMRQDPGIQDALWQADWVVPVPLSRQRLAQRGFNQALELSKHLLNVPRGQAVPRARLLAQPLLRVRDTPAQVGLTREQRQRNLQHAFAIEPLHAGPIQNTRIVLVDDVTTTLSTLSAAAAALKAAGAGAVVGLVFARTPL